MKRALSVLISFILFVTSLSVGLVSVAQTVPQESALDAFASELIDMVRVYDNQKVYNKDSEIGDSTSDSLDEIVNRFPIEYTTEMYNLNSRDETDVSSLDNEYISKSVENLPKTAFDAKRLIVKSKNEIDFCGAIDCVSGYRDLYILQYETYEDVVLAYEYYLSLNSIEYVEPDYIQEMQGDIEIIEDAVVADLDTDAEEYYYEIVDLVKSWNSEDIGFENIKNELAQTKLVDITVAVLDSGVDTDHEIFEDRLLESNINFSSTGDPDSCEDDFGHGTHVAGIVVDNTLSNVKIKPYKVLNNKGKGSTSTIAIAVDLAVAEGADIINMSLTAEGECQTLTDSVDSAVENGVNVVVAAGNESADLSKKYYTPACIESAMTVSAVTKDHKLASYSNYNGTIDIAAPGDDIKSSYLNNTYVLLDGTSMAAPQVAAGLAIIRSVYEEKTNIEAEEMLKEYSIKMLEDGTNHFGAGLLYLKYILQSIPRTAEPVFSVSSGEFVNTFKVSITCPEEAAKILYVIYEGEFDGDYNDEEDFEVGFLNGTLYKSPITISIDTTIVAVAISDGKMFSPVVVAEYDRSNRTEADLYDINNLGMITGYVGTEADLVIPSTVQNKAVRGIAASAFENNSTIRSVTLPKTATNIGNYAFRNCSALETVKGESVSYVGTSSFENSTISVFPFEQLISVGNKAFSGCNNLVNVNLASVETIGTSSFENAKSVIELSCEKLTSIGAYAFRGTEIQTINLPIIESIGTGVFEKCTGLVTVYVPNLKTVSASAYKNCYSLNKIDASEIISIGANAFQGTALKEVYFENLQTIANYAFKDATSLTYAVLSNTATLGVGVFMGCINLDFIYLPALKELNSNTFASCDSLKSAWLPSVKTVNKNAFNNSSIEYLQFDTVEKIESLPSTLVGLIFPTSLVEITATVPETDFTVYGYEDTFAYQYAQENSKEFVTVPVMCCEVPESVSTEEQYLIAFSIGFNCTYQWYKNDTVSNENGTPIEGATNFWYEPVREDNAVAYYCVITSDDCANSNTVITAPIKNAPEYQEADYTAYNAVIEEVSLIDRDLYTAESLAVLDDLLATDISGYSLAEQELIENHITEIKNAISSLILDYMLGDINGDGKISVLDARIALKTVSGTQALDELQNLAADVNEDGKISLIDVRMLLRIISGAEETV